MEFSFEKIQKRYKKGVPEIINEKEWTEDQTWKRKEKSYDVISAKGSVTVDRISLDENCLLILANKYGDPPVTAIECWRDVHTHLKNLSLKL